MLIGYARTSTSEQVAGYQSQRAELEKAGAERIFSEQLSSVAERPELERALAFLRPGDVLVVTALDRLARSMPDLLAIVERIKQSGASLRVLGALGIDTSGPTGELILHVLGAVAAFERSIMLARQRSGIDKAKREGKYRGRVPTVQNRADEIVTLLQQGHGPTAVARMLNIGRTSVWRVQQQMPWTPDNPVRRAKSKQNV